MRCLPRLGLEIAILIVNDRRLAILALKWSADQSPERSRDTGAIRLIVLLRHPRLFAWINESEISQQPHVVVILRSAHPLHPNHTYEMSQLIGHGGLL